MNEFAADAAAIRARFAAVCERVAAAASTAGRNPADIEILVATKYVPVEAMGTLRDAGIKLVGENRAQALVEKHEAFGDQFVFDFIGRLQSRKTRLVLPLARLIHSVESMSVVEEIQARSLAAVDVLLEVNVDEEESKAGLVADEIDAFLERADSCDKVRFVGLMCMPPLFAEPEQARPSFVRTRELADRLSDAWRGRYTFARLSMGTSADYEVAVQEGATIVRVGSVLF